MESCFLGKHAGVCHIWLMTGLFFSEITSIFPYTDKHAGFNRRALTGGKVINHVAPAVDQCGPVEESL